MMPFHQNVKSGLKQFKGSFPSNTQPIFLAILVAIPLKVRSTYLIKLYLYFSFISRIQVIIRKASYIGHILPFLNLLWE